MEPLRELAALIAQRNEIDAAIGAHIGRPASVGHIGEYVAARVFDIELEASATARGIDGRFKHGPLAGKSVNVKFYPKREGTLDVAGGPGPDLYLVLAGPRSAAASSRNTLRPIVIEAVYLFDGAALLDMGLKPGTCASVRAPLWAAAAVYPGARNPALPVTAEQAAALALFRPASVNC